MKSIQTEFFDEENRYKKLTELGDPPEELNSVMEEKIDLLRDKCAILRKKGGNSDRFYLTLYSKKCYNKIYYSRKH